MIPLQRLPFLAGREVIKCLDPQSIIVMSQTSRKGRALLKSLLPNYRLRVEFHISTTNLEVMVNGPNQEKILAFDIFPVVGNQDIKDLVEFFIDIFSKPIVTIILKGVTGEFAVELIKMVKQLPCRFYELNFRNVAYTPRILKQVLDECTDLHELNVENILIPIAFQYVPPSPDAFKLRKLKGVDTKWMKLEDFMQCKCIVLYDEWQNPNTAQYLINCISKWMNSECALEFLELHLVEDDIIPLLIEKLGDREIKREGNKQYFEIQRKDGKKAVITCIDEDGLDDDTIFDYRITMETQL